MAEVNEHKNQFSHNKEFVEKIIRANPLYNDWTVTGYFYCSLHMVEAVLATQKEHSTAHSKRDELINRYLSLFGIDMYKAYTQLQALSRKARYEAVEITDEEADKARRCTENIIETCSRKIEKVPG